MRRRHRHCLDQTLSFRLAIDYRKISNERRTKSQNLNDYPIILQLSLPDPLKGGVKSRMKM